MCVFNCTGYCLSIVLRVLVHQPVLLVYMAVSDAVQQWDTRAPREPDSTGCSNSFFGMIHSDDL